MFMLPFDVMVLHVPFHGSEGSPALLQDPVSLGPMHAAQACTSKWKGPETLRITVCGPQISQAPSQHQDSGEQHEQGAFRATVAARDVSARALPFLFSFFFLVFFAVARSSVAHAGQEVGDPIYSTFASKDQPPRPSPPTPGLAGNGMTRGRQKQQPRTQPK